MIIRMKPRGCGGVTHSKSEVNLLEDECPYDNQTDFETTLKLVQIPLIEKQPDISDDEGKSVTL